MHKILWLSVLLLPSLALAQSTAVTGTITDGDGNAWANGTYQVSFVPAPQSTTATWNSTTLNAGVYASGSLDSSGAISVSLPKNSVVSPKGNNWLFTICPNASAACFTYLTSFSTSSIDLTSVLSAATIAPRFSAGPYAHGYTDAEVYPLPPPGGTYYDVTTSKQRIWSGSAWSDNGGSGSGNDSYSGTQNDVACGTGTAHTLGDCSPAIVANGTSVALPSNTTVTTQSANDNSTKAASTAYADRAVANGPAVIACGSVTVTPILGQCSITLTDAQVNGATSPFTLIPALGSNIFVDVLETIIEYKKGSADFTCPGLPTDANLGIYYTDDSSGVDASPLTACTGFLDGGTGGSKAVVFFGGLSMNENVVAGAPSGFVDAVDLSLVANAPVVLQNANAATTVGTDSTVTIFIVYRIITFN